MPSASATPLTNAAGYAGPAPANTGRSQPPPPSCPVKCDEPGIPASPTPLIDKHWPRDLPEFVPLSDLEPILAGSDGHARLGEDGHLISHPAEQLPAGAAALRDAAAGLLLLPAGFYRGVGVGR